MRAVAAATLAVLALGGADITSAQDVNDLPQPEHYMLRLQYSEFRPPDVSGKIKKSAADRDDGTLLDLDDDLGIDNKRTFEVKGVIQWKPGRKFRGSYTPVDFGGTTQSKVTFFYGTSRYLRDTVVGSSVKGSYYSADVEWDFVRNQHGFLGAVIGAKMFDLDSVVAAPSQGIRETDSLTIPIPVIGLAGRGYLGRLSLGGEITGLSVGERGYIFDAEGSVRLHVSDRLGAQVGYRVLSVDGKDGGDRVKLKTSGLLFGLELSL
jgi:hypothetical protein